MMAAIAGQPHPDVSTFMRRVTANSATVRPEVQVALNEFVKRCYRLGVRNIQGNQTNHQIKMCYIPLTEQVAPGLYQKLWFATGTQSAMSTPSSNPVMTYTESAGLTVAGRRLFVDSVVAANATGVGAMNPNTSPGCMLFFHNLTEVSSKDYFGSNDAAVGSGTNIFSINPKWSDNNNIYFDVGNNSTGRINTPVTNTVGLTVAFKNGATQAIYMRGASAVRRTTAPTSGLTLASDTMTAVYSSSNDDLNGVLPSRSIAGFGSGLAMSETNIPLFTEAWNTLQAVMGRAIG